MDTLATCKYPRSTGPDFWECACSIRKECAEYRILVASPDISGTRETELPQRSGRCLFRIPNSELIVFAYFRTSRFSLFLTFPLPSFLGPCLSHRWDQVSDKKSVFLKRLDRLWSVHTVLLRGLFTGPYLSWKAKAPFKNQDMNEETHLVPSLDH